MKSFSVVILATLICCCFGFRCFHSFECREGDECNEQGQCVNARFSRKAAIPSPEFCDKTSDCNGLDEMCDGLTRKCINVRRFFQVDSVEGKKCKVDSGCEIGEYCDENSLVCKRYPLRKNNIISNCKYDSEDSCKFPYICNPDSGVCEDFSHHFY